jgi:hypothetical protein
MCIFSGYVKTFNGKSIRGCFGGQKWILKNMKNPLKETAQRPQKRQLWQDFMICGWLLPQNHSPAGRKLNNFRSLKFILHDLRTPFCTIFGAKVSPPGYPVVVRVPEKGHLGSGKMGHPNLDEKNGCWKILPASGLVW